MNNKPLPWFFFFQLFQISLLSLLPFAIAVGIFDVLLFKKAFPYLLISTLVAFALSFSLSKKFKDIIFLKNKIKRDLPFRNQLDLFYQKNEWRDIEEALKFATSQITSQTHLFQSEKEKLLVILESISESIVAVDLYESVLFSNSNFKSNFKIPMQFQGITEKVWHYFTDEKIRDLFIHCLKTGETSQTHELKLITLNGETKYFNITVSPLKDSDGLIKGALGFFYDITQQLNTQRMRVDFVANISHEIKTPLTSLMGFTQMLQNLNIPLDENAKKVIGKIVNNSEKINLLFSDLLNLSVIENKKELKKEKANLEEILNYSLEIIRKIYPSREIHPIYDLTYKDIFVDVDLFGQIFNNLIDNSVKYSHQDKVSIKIHSHSTRNQLCIVFSDNGPGISDDDREKIFERFFRSNVKKHSINGTGLGLSIVKQIIHKHEGEIKVTKTTPSLEIEIKIPIS